MAITPMYLHECECMKMEEVGLLLSSFEHLRQWATMLGTEDGVNEE